MKRENREETSWEKIQDKFSPFGMASGGIRVIGRKKIVGTVKWDTSVHRAGGLVQVKLLFFFFFFLFNIT